MVETEQISRVIQQIANVAHGDAAVAAAVRAAIVQSGLLDVFGVGESLDVVDLLDGGGEEALRARLGQLTLADLRAIVRTRAYDPERASARWRSPARFVDLIVERAKAQLEAEQQTAAPTKALAEASWML